MGVSAVGVAAAAVAAANAILRGAEREAFDTGPDYMKDGTPDGIVGRIGLGIARQACRRYADDPGQVDDPQATSFETVCRPYLDNIGYGVGPELEKPFEGGQCQVSYFVGVIRGFNSTAVDAVPSPVAGPITGYSAVEVGPGPSGTRQVSVVFSHPAGQSTLTLNLPADDTSVTPNIRRVDGQPDECGDPPPVIVDPVAPVTPGPPTEPFNPGPDIDINIEVNIQPDALIEVNLGLGPVIIAPFGGGGDGGGDPTDPSDPGSGDPGVPEAGPEVIGGNGGFGGDDAFGDEPAGRRWVGACIRITSTPANAGVIATSEPEDVYPSVIGNARLVYDAFGSRVVDTPVQIRAKGVCLWEPVRGMNPVAVNVDLLPGYAFVYRAYSVPADN